ncbi:MAG: hypothetical protein DI598_07150 [Pseudopedobacter saltans]|uniref:TonB C-terminal domain-containing protein n=1 Tax=Pseudopedobacter saltans TaxID=151895 RepID=A0A2W5F0I3_9SPHI|nr:MAG: hypothetical protein DI598_07150 [Pseudopedobacter saltans]
MKKNLLITLSLLLLSISFVHAATDTTFQYLSKINNPALPEFAYYVVKIYPRTNGRWEKDKLEIESKDTVQVFLSSKNDFDKNKCDTAIYIGSARIYYIKMDKDREKTEIYTNGKFSGYCIRNAKREVVEQKGWDDSGREIPDYICQQEANFIGGPPAWKEFLIKNLKDVAKQNKAPRDFIYKVRVSFTVDKDGTITDVRALDNPGYGTAEEAVRVVASSPKWQPAIQNNKPVIYRQRQMISFQVN